MKKTLFLLAAVIIGSRFAVAQTGADQFGKQMAEGSMNRLRVLLYSAEALRMDEKALKKAFDELFKAEVAACAADPNGEFAFKVGDNVIYTKADGRVMAIYPDGKVVVEEGGRARVVKAAQLAKTSGSCYGFTVGDRVTDGDEMNGGLRFQKILGIFPNGKIVTTRSNPGNPWVSDVRNWARTTGSAYGLSVGDRVYSKGYERPLTVAGFYRNGKVAATAHEFWSFATVLKAKDLVLAETANAAQQSEAPASEEH